MLTSKNIPTAPNKPRGRPLSDDLHQRVISTVWDMLATNPVGTLTIKEIAIAAEASRPAIYRRWSNVEEIAIEAFMSATVSEVPSPDIADPAEALRAYIHLLTNFMQGRGGRVIAQILGQAQSTPILLAKFHDTFLTIRRDHGRSLIQRGQQLGVFDQSMDTELAIDLYAGPIYFRLISKHAPLDGAFSDQLADRVLAAILIRNK